MFDNSNMPPGGGAVWIWKKTKNCEQDKGYFLFLIWHYIREYYNLSNTVRACHSLNNYNDTETYLSH